VSARGLSQAGITDPQLRASYELCRQLNARYGKTYYLATQLLPAWKRPYVHALYAFARFTDEIVDGTAGGGGTTERAEQLRRWADGFLADAKAGRSADPLRRAVLDTMTRWRIPVEHFEAFLASMAMDLRVREYRTYQDLLGYVYGSASVIGLQMVPILQPLTSDAHGPARDLGTAFQLANFVRDVGEDLDMGRLYLPLEDLDRFGLSRADLERRVVDDRVRDLLRYQIARVRRLEAAARPGIVMLDATSRPCIEAARVLYCGIVDEVERADYQVFSRRVRVGLGRRLAVAGPAWLAARKARRGGFGALPGSAARA
jgi:15-cis-phytoene synthase